ncbi:MAG: hypothetical protein KUG58_05925 [Marinosulfonomonas sp.]|nr:hypothetical protein [Marinosulfonomonas sp.]
MSNTSHTHSQSISTPFFSELRDAVAQAGGIFNAHLHLDRAGTFHDTVRMLRALDVHNGASLSIAGKHALIPMIHDCELYDVENLKSRASSYLSDMADLGTTRVDTVVDVTTDRVGRTAMDAFLQLKKQFLGRLDFRVGAYTPLGFRDDEPERWDLVSKAAEDADFIGLLPERDDKEMYPDNIGFRECCRRAIALAQKLDKQIHVHVDQANHQHENGSEIIVDVVRELNAGRPQGAEPLIWLIHVISPSTYEEDRFARLCDDLSALNIGIVSCPSAAISMRQLRPLQSPTSNCIARIPEFLAAGIHVRLGSDNICDITSPMGTIDLIQEVFVLANAMRFYDMDVLTKLATGQRLELAEQERMKSHLATEDVFVKSVMSGLATNGHD